MKPGTLKGRPRSARRAKPSFSIVTVVRNESRRFPLLLESIAEFRSRGGEVLVLDTGSADGTPDLARKAGCRVVVEPRRFNRRLTRKEVNRINKTFSKGGEGPFLLPGERLFNFAAARNHAASLARHPFQLAVDGSDIVEVLDIDALDAAVRSGRFDVLLFETRRLHVHRFLVETRDYFHDRRTMRWAGRAHNYVTGLRRNVPFRTALLPRDQLRVTHHTDKTKARGYQLAGVALDVLRQPHPPSRELLMGGELGFRGYYRSALAVLLALDRDGVPAPYRSAALGMAANCVADQGKEAQDEVTELLMLSATRDPRRRDPFIQLARRAMAAGDLQAAASFASAALSIPAQVGLSEPEDNHLAGPHAILYWALLWLGRRDEARKHFAICLKLDPQNPVYRDHAKLFA